MPRPILRDKFNITYRKIPVLVIGRDVSVDLEQGRDAKDSLQREAWKEKTRDRRTACWRLRANSF